MFNKNQTVVNNKSLETIIGPSVRVEGDFRGEGDLIIEGTLVGNLQTKNNLKIGENAVIEASVKANNAFISGRVKGNLIIKGKLEITSTAIILGDIKTQLISVESGAIIQGSISMPTSESAKDEPRKSKEKMPEITENEEHSALDQ